MPVAEISAPAAHIAELNRKFKDEAGTDEACRRLVEMPGIGPVIATAVVTTVPDDQRFSSGRHFAAWLGLTPKQHSSGGKERLLGISKPGDAYMRRQFINGARALVRIASRRTGGLWVWINALLSRGAPSTSLRSRTPISWPESHGHFKHVAFDGRLRDATDEEELRVETVRVI